MGVGVGLRKGQGQSAEGGVSLTKGDRPKQGGGMAAASPGKRQVDPALPVPLWLYHSGSAARPYR